MHQIYDVAAGLQTVLIVGILRENVYFIPGPVVVTPNKSAAHFQAVGKILKVSDETEHEKIVKCIFKFYWKYVSLSHVGTVYLEQ